jgi:hypothetical protein
MHTEPVSPAFLTAYAGCCERIASGAERPYDVALELMGVIADPNELPKLPGATYSMWGELTDVCELRGEQACLRAEELMRLAASEFLAFDDAGSELAEWSEAWMERLAADELLRA